MDVFFQVILGLMTLVFGFFALIFLASNDSGMWVIGIPALLATGMCAYGVWKLD